MEIEAVEQEFRKNK